MLLVLPSFLRFVASAVVAPVNITKSWFLESGESLPQYLRNRTELIDEISRLRSDVAATEGDKHTIKTLTDENEELRSLLGHEGEDRILAGIIGRPGLLPYDSLMIDQGTNDGIVEGAPVYIGDSTVVGIVRNAAHKTSVVELVTSPGFEATVFIMGPDIYTNAVGIGGGQLRVGVPQGIPLSEGDLVVLPSVASGVYGEISIVQSVPSRPEQYGFVSPQTPLASIRFVSVGTIPMKSISFEEAQAILAETKEKVFTIPVPDEVLVDTEMSSSTASTTDDLQINEET